MRRTIKGTIAMGLLALAVPAAADAAKTATPASVSFPATQVDQTSATQAVTVGINAADDFRNMQIGVGECSTPGGACQACSSGGFCDFKIVSSTCPPSFPPGDQTCVVNVAFTPYNPASLGLKFGTLDIGTGWPSVSLSGTSIFDPPAGGGKKKKKCKKKGKKSASAAKKCGKKKK
jgi:hypothetical protein